MRHSRAVHERGVLMKPEKIGRYKVVEELGSGSQGTVYKCWDDSEEHYIAIKAIRNQDFDSKGSHTQDIFREADAAGRLNHPGIVRVLEAGHDGELAYMVMELAGQDLDKVLKAGKMPFDARFSRLILQAAEALDHAHFNKIIHRDVKPSNILKIADFGVAKDLTLTLRTRTGGIGTAYYVAPEIVKGEAATTRSDQYSLAVVAYEMLTGHLPFTADPKEPSGLPDEVCRALEKGLATRPEERYGNCTEFANALGRPLREISQSIVFAREAIDKGQPEEAEAQVTRISQLDPQNADIPRLRETIHSLLLQKERRDQGEREIASGKTWMERGRFAGAKAKFETAIPYFYDAAGAAEARRLRDEAEQAERKVQDALREAQRLFEQGSFAEAVETLMRRLDDAPGEPRLTCQCASILTSLGLFDDAAHQIELGRQTWREDDPRWDQARRHLAEEKAAFRWRALLSKARSEFGRGYWDAALGLLDDAIRDAPDEFELTRLREQIQEEAAIRRRIEVVDKAVAAAQDQASEGKYAEAIDALNAVLSKLPGDARLVAVRESLAYRRDQESSKKQARRVSHLFHKDVKEDSTELPPPHPGPPSRFRRNTLIIAGALVVLVVVGVTVSLVISTLSQRRSDGVYDQFGMGYVLIPAGQFNSGCSSGVDCRKEDPDPVRHDVKAFWMGATEVTVAAFRKQTGGYMPQAPPFNLGWSDDQQPIVRVTWEEARKYCEAVKGRLPKEWEWEYAARGGVAQARYASLDTIAWYIGNSDGRAHPVGKKTPNAYGLYDVLGNVWEWTVDPYLNSPENIVQRGGSWAMDARFVRIWQQYARSASAREDDLGFRCVSDDPPK